jgi:hypothetical protein
MTTLFILGVGKFWTNKLGPSGSLQLMRVGGDYQPNVLLSQRLDCIETGLYSVKDKMAKRMLQCTINTFPTRSRLHVMGNLEDGQCKFHACIWSGIGRLEQGFSFLQVLVLVIKLM